MKQKTVKGMLSALAAMVMSANLFIAPVSAEMYTDIAQIQSKLDNLEVDLTNYNKLSNKDVVLQELLGMDFADDEEFKTAFENAMEKYYVEEKLYPIKIVKLSGSNASVGDISISLSSNTIGILSFDVINSSNIIDLEFAAANYGFTSTQTAGVNNYIFGDLPTADDYTAWNTFIENKSESMALFTSTGTVHTYASTSGLYDSIKPGIGVSRYLTLRIKKEDSANVVAIWANHPELAPYIKVVRDNTKNVASFLANINNSSDEFCIVNTLNEYLNSVGLDYERYEMIGNKEAFAGEFVGKHFASFSDFYGEFNAMLDKYVRATELTAEVSASYAANQFGPIFDTFNINTNNNQSGLYCFKFANIDSNTIAGVKAVIRNKQDNENDSGLLLKYQFIDAYPGEITYGVAGTDVHTAWYTNLIDGFKSMNTFRILLPKAADAYLEENLSGYLLSEIKQNKDKILMLNAATGNTQSNYLIKIGGTKDPAKLIIYNDLSDMYAGLQNILNGTDADTMRAWVEANGSAIGVNANALYDMSDVYTALSGKTFESAEALAAAFDAEISNHMAVKYVVTANDVTAASSNSTRQFTFYQTKLEVANGNGWTNIIASFPIISGEYIKNIEFVNTLGFNVGADNKVMVKGFTTNPIPELPDAEPSKEGFTSELDTPLNNAWLEYYNSMLGKLDVSHVYSDSDKDKGSSVILPLGDDVVKAIGADTSNLSILISGDGNIQIYSPYSTDTAAIPAQLKITYDATAIDYLLTAAINSADTAETVREALDKYGFVLDSYEWYNALTDAKKTAAANALTANKSYENAAAISAALKEFENIDSTRIFKTIAVTKDDSGKITNTTIQKLNPYDEKPTVCLVYYKNNYMVHFEAVTPVMNDIFVDTEVNFAGDFDGEYDKAKVLVLNSLQSIKPLADSFIVE